MIYHIVQGVDNGARIVETIALGKDLAGSVTTIEDSFSFGPLRDEQIPFDQLRSQFWSELQAKALLKQSTQLNDLANLTHIIQNASVDNGDEIWYWMGSAPDDLITYYFLLHYLKQFAAIFKVININGLPFLDDDLKLFYPKSFAEIPLREINKARKLARLLAPSEWEADIDEWKYIVANQHLPIRVYKGGKKIEFNDLEWAMEQVASIMNNEPIKLPKLLLKINPLNNHWRQIYYQSIMQTMQKEGKLKFDQQIVSSIT